VAWTIKPAGSWGVATSNAPATDVAAVLALPGSWRLDQYPQAPGPTQRLFVRKDQWGSLAAAPGVDSVTPNTGTAAGGTAVALAGDGLTGSTGVTFAGSAATSVAVVNDALITCVTPAHAAGPVNVVVANPRGNVTITGGYTYV
jgi:hypothetical protein